MEKESFIGAFGDVPTDLAGDYSQLYIFRAEDFGAWCRRVRDAHEREVDGSVAGMTDAQLAEHGWVKLPKDADGVPFHIGDKVDSDHYEDGTVTGIQYGLAANGAIRKLVAVQPNGWDTATWRDPEEYAHRHEPTVEDVLRAMLDALDVDVCDDPDATIAEYAAKFRLAKEDA